MAVFFTARYFLRERLPVRVAQVGYATLLNTVSTNGRVEPVVNYQYYSPITTTVKTVYAQEGDLVPAGKLLITLDDVEARAQVASAQSAVISAQAALDAATHNGTLAERQASAAAIEQDSLARDQDRQNLDALVQLASTGAASQGEVAAARAQLQTAQASLSAAEQTAHHRYSAGEVARARAALADAQAALAAARHVEAQTSYYAPITGTFYTLDAAPSEFSEAGKLLLQMADLRHERVRGYFDEPDLGRLATGQKVLIHWDAMPGREWHGHIARLPVTVVTYTTRNVGEVLIDFDSSDNGLLPDTNVTLTVTTSSESNALNMPRDALHEQNGKYFVFKVVHHQLQRVPVTIGTPNLTQVPILSGLQEGDSVATGTTNGQPLQQGIPIKEEP
jgi:HlyD family secretion protein